MSDAKTLRIRRYGVSYRDDLRVYHYRSSAQAEIELSVLRLQAPRMPWRLIAWDVPLNQTIKAYGVQKFDKILTGIGDFGLTLVGTRAELLECGVAADYMFEQLAEQGQRSGPTEYGDSFKLQRLGSGTFELNVYFHEDAKKPYGMSKIDPYDTDISDILARLGGAK